MLLMLLGPQTQPTTPTSPTPDNVEKWARLISDYGLAVVISTVFIIIVIMAVKLAYDYYAIKIKQNHMICPRAVEGNCPGMNVPRAELETLLAVRHDLKKASDLTNHQLFGNIRALKITTIPSLNIKDPGRRLVFQDLLTTKLTTIAAQWDLWLQQNLSKVNEDHLDGQFLFNAMMSLIADIVTSYEGDCRRMGLPEEAISAFHSFHNDAIYDLCEDIKGTCHSDWIIDSTQRVGLIMSHFEAAVIRALTDCETAQAKLNGSLTGKVYRGFTCGSIDKVSFERSQPIDIPVEFAKKLEPRSPRQKDTDSGVHPALNQ